MPILEQETDLHPDGLLNRPDLGTEVELRWWAIYTMARREKDLMRRLRALDVPFYGPMISKSNRSPAGRVRTSFVPLFQSYVFVYTDDSGRYQALTTNCVSRCIPVPNGPELTRDLRQIHHLIESGLPLTVERRLEAGRVVQVRQGPLQGLQGVIMERQSRRLLVAVNFLQQGASVSLDESNVELHETAGDDAAGLCGHGR